MLEPPLEPLPALRWKEVSALEGGGSSVGRGSQRGFERGFQHWKGVPAGLQEGFHHSFYLHIGCSPPTFLAPLCPLFTLIMDCLNFPVLASWFDKANALVGTRGY